MPILYNKKNFMSKPVECPVKHLGVIMDGNGRWAQKRGLPRWKGHEMGVHAVERLAEAALNAGISFVTIFAFSSENWRRPESEVRILFSLLQRFFATERKKLLDGDIRITVFGRRDRIPVFVREAVEGIEEDTKNCRRLNLRIALDYGSRYEIVEAARSLVRVAVQRHMPPESISEEAVSKALSTSGIPDPDLIIRTAGERRLSNFLLWQAAYAELYFIPKLWPDFDGSDLENAIDDFRSRTRRFGALPCAAGSGRTASIAGRTINRMLHEG